ncbi:MAG: Sorbitol operon regulator, partial [Pedosphaera sp.]|nr:Sorbitol operon regulator [Pedosphaera sp.]
MRNAPINRDGAARGSALRRQPAVFRPDHLKAEIQTGTESKRVRELALESTEARYMWTDAKPRANGRIKMQNNYSDEQLRLAARLYYVDGLGQVEVAKFVKVSQTKISRLLALARERGIVRISVAEYEPRDQKLELALQQKFGLKAVAVIKTIAGATSEDARLTVAHFGAPFVASLVSPNSTVAISGGRTMRELVQLLPENKGLRLTVLQAMGSIDSNVGPVDAFELGRSMARRWGGSFSTLNSPAFVPDKKTRDAFLNLQQIRSVWERLGHVDVALVGIGTLDNSVFVERGVLSADDLETLSRRGAVGEVCGRFYDEKGRECDSLWRDRVISIDLDQLRKTPQVIGIIAGGDRSAAITAAIRGGLLKSLVID